MISNKFKSIFLLLPVLVFFTLTSKLYAATVVGDSINVSRIVNAPVIDGSAIDLCWDSAVWNPMPYVWIVYGQKVDSSDFYGRFKAVWSEQEQLMYFLFEITDDKFVNGYEFSTSNGNYYQFDVVEIFIDENRSGGNHEKNNNAFAYHITGGNSTSEYDAVDMSTTTIVNYKDHFPEFKRVQNGNIHTWEFSLMVLKDTYTPSSSAENFKAPLTAGKPMGFSVAYCDNDNSAINPRRDHFIGSKYLTQANSNNSYINASIFGFMKLVNEPPSGGSTASEAFFTKTNALTGYPNPVSESMDISFSDNFRGKVGISIFSPTGQVIREMQSDKYQAMFLQKVDCSQLNAGIYFIRISAGDEYSYLKIVKTASK